ncbi:hypothetical protein DZF83_25160 [Vibrio parahaemolyticus]|nr:hypothetical protein [Vibrio parahaemolyticus]
MAIPLIIGGIVALATGTLGAGAYLSAKEKGEKATEIYEKGNKKQKSQSKKLEAQQNKTKEAAESLGLLKLELQKNEIARFLDLYSKLGKLNITGIAQESLSFGFTPEEIKTMEKVSMNATEILGAGVQSLAGGALVGAGVYSSVMAFGTASTTTAISTLSGAAATNATLAWLGGGSIASGGLGMTAGAAALGLWVAGPAILVAGAIADSKAEKALTEAEKFLADVDIACEKMKTEQVLLKSVAVRCGEFDTVLNQIRDRLNPSMDELSDIIDTLSNASQPTDTQLKSIHTTLLLAKTLKDIVNINILNSDGSLNSESKNISKSLT